MCTFLKREHQDLKSLPCEVLSWFTLRMQSGGDVKVSWRVHES